jgi:anaerobic ribonucleoside-triphosphate reductase
MQVSTHIPECLSLNQPSEQGNQGKRAFTQEELDEEKRKRKEEKRKKEREQALKELCRGDEKSINKFISAGIKAFVKETPKEKEVKEKSFAYEQKRLKLASELEALDYEFDQFLEWSTTDMENLLKMKQLEVPQAAQLVEEVARQMLESVQATNDV